MNVCRAFQEEEEKVNNSIAATEVKKICTEIYGRTLIVLFVVFSLIHTRTYNMTTYNGEK
jgi:hypothetical protein